VHQRLQQLDHKPRVAQEVTVVHNHSPQQLPELKAAPDVFHWQSPSPLNINFNLPLLQRSLHFDVRIANRHHAVADNIAHGLTLESILHLQSRHWNLLSHERQRAAVPASRLYGTQQLRHTHSFNTVHCKRPLVHKLQVRCAN
jgi:hypothetical protein